MMIVRWPAPIPELVLAQERQREGAVPCSNFQTIEFHCLISLVLISSAFGLLTDKASGSSPRCSPSPGHKLPEKTVQTLTQVNFGRPLTISGEACIPDTKNYGCLDCLAGRPCKSSSCFGLSK